MHYLGDTILSMVLQSGVSGLQSRERIIKEGDFYYQVGQLLLQSRAVQQRSVFFSEVNKKITQN